jgi:hypothetical protein
MSCGNERRRELVRAHESNGLDYLEIDGSKLTVYFLGKAPHRITKENIRIDGGRRITGLHAVSDPRIVRDPAPGVDDYMEITVDRIGDFSTYILRVIERGTEAPLGGFDRRYSSLPFRFRLQCASDLDCVQTPVCPEQQKPKVEINYLAKDYESFRQVILDRMALLVPEWRQPDIPDTGVAVVEALAYVADHLSYLQDAVATEAYLDTARQRISVRRHALLVDYRMHEGCNARAWVHVSVKSKLELTRNQFFFTTLLPDTRLAAYPAVSDFDVDPLARDRYEVFEPLPEAVVLHPGHGEIEIYTWGDTECCLDMGSISATLVDGQSERILSLKQGDYLLLEEKLGPATGLEADADPSHRHVVRIVSTERLKDNVTGQRLLEVQWAVEDALPFPLCLSNVVGKDCRLQTSISVARGNIIPVDHGRTVTGLTPEAVDTVSGSACCEREGHPADEALTAALYRPALLHGPLLFSETYDPTRSASLQLDQDPVAALPGLVLNDGHWQAKSHLLTSGPEDKHFVVEMDNSQIGRLRFGDGDLGAAPDAHLKFDARYRIGEWRAGNIGADRIRHLVLRGITTSSLESVRNPLPARGGAAPQPIEEAKLFAPHAFRRQLQRAITAEDYASVVQSSPFGARIQRAAARFEWTGSWPRVVVLLDPLASVGDPEALASGVQMYLEQFRRIGHEVVVKIAKPVPLDVEISFCLDPAYQHGHVRAALMDLFSSRTLAGGRTGYFHPDKFSFGDPILVSHMLAAAQSVPGVASVQVSVLKRQFEEDRGELAAGLLAIGADEVAQVENDPSFPEHGTFDAKRMGSE